MRVRLTDQALVAVAAARRNADVHGREATLADLVLGLAGAPDGVVGAWFGATPAVIAALAARVPSSSSRLPAADIAIAWAAGAVDQRPLWTSDLLAAALEVGAGDLADLLEAAAIDPRALADIHVPTAMPDPVDHPEQLTETFGYDPAGDADLTPAAARALARARALGGGAVALLTALVVEAVLDPEAVPLDPEAVRDRLGRARLAGDQDTSLDALLETAGRIRQPSTVLRPLDLLRAIAVAGGPPAAALLGGAAHTNEESMT